jgi:ribosomal protein S5
VDIWPRRLGSGIKASRIGTSLMQRLGITDVGVKFYGSKNKAMQLKATIKALTLVESHEVTHRAPVAWAVQMSVGLIWLSCRKRRSVAA